MDIMLFFACVITVFLSKVVSANVPDLAVLVNRFVIRTQGDPNEKTIRTAIYHYGDGDAVDVSCVTTHKCSIELNYDYAERLHEAFKTADLLSHSIVGFRTKLQVKHNDTSVVCKRICSGDLSVTVQIKFILGNFEPTDGVNNKIKLKINGMITREMSLYDYSDTKGVSLIYNSANENLNIEANANSAGINLKWYYNDTRTQNYITNETSMNITLFPPMTTDLFIYISMQAFATFKCYEYIRIHFVNLPVFRPLDLTLNLTKENTEMELYNYPFKQWFYYEYQDGDSLTLNCSLSRPIHGMIISFNGTKERRKNCISKTFHLTAADDETTHKCILKERDTKEIKERFKEIRKIVIVFSERKQNNTMLIIGCSVGVAVFVLIICILYWWRRRKITIKKQNAQMYVNTRVENTKKKMRPKFPEPSMLAIQDVINQCEKGDKVTYANMSVDIQKKIKKKSMREIPKRPEKPTKQNPNTGKNREHVTPNENSSRQNRKSVDTRIYDYVRHSQIIRTFKCRNIRNDRTHNNIITISKSVEENVYDYAVGY